MTFENRKSSLIADITKANEAAEKMSLQNRRNNPLAQVSDKGDDDALSIGHGIDGLEGKLESIPEYTGPARVANQSIDSGTVTVDNSVTNNPPSFKNFLKAIQNAKNSAVVQETSQEVVQSSSMMTGKNSNSTQ